MKQIGKERARGESMQAGWRIEPSSVQIRVVSSANKGPAAIQFNYKKNPGRKRKQPHSEKTFSGKLNAFNACGASKWISEQMKLLLFSLKSRHIHQPPTKTSPPAIKFCVVTYLYIYFAICHMPKSLLSKRKTKITQLQPFGYFPSLFVYLRWWCPPKSCAWISHYTFARCVLFAIFCFLSRHSQKHVTAETGGKWAEKSGSITLTVHQLTLGKKRATKELINFTGIV